MSLNNCGAPVPATVCAARGRTKSRAATSIPECRSAGLRPRFTSSATPLRRRFCQRLDVMKLAVVHMQRAILILFQNVMEGRVPADVLAGSLGPGRQHLARRFVRTAHAEDQSRARFVQ